MTTTYITSENTRIDVPDGVTLAQFWATNAPGVPLPTIIMTSGPEVPEYARGALPAVDFAKYRRAVKEYEATKSPSGSGMIWLLGAAALGLVLFMRGKKR